MRTGNNAIAALLLGFSLLNIDIVNGKKATKPIPGSQHNRGPAKIGEHHPIRVSSIDETASDIQPTTSQDGKRSVYTLKHEGASYIAVHFSTFYVPPSCFVEISDALGEQKTTLRGKGRHNLGSFWARHVAGDTMIITMQCNGNKHEASFNIDDYVSGFPILSGEIPEWGPEERRNLRRSKENVSERNPFMDSRALGTCGIDDRKNAICYKDSHPTEYDHAKAVARLFINGSGACTGWLVGPHSMLLTNEHCITSLSDVLNTDFEFMGEEPTCDSVSGDCWLCDRGHIFDGTHLLVDNEDEDFALVQLAGNPADTYGFLDLDNRIPIVGEEIYMPQHPGGRAKEFGIEDTSTTSGFCEIKAITGVSCTGSNAYSDVRYTCESEGGTSGAPVLARSNHKVIALHHCGVTSGCYGNMGVPVTQFFNTVTPFIDAGSPPLPPPTDAPASSPTNDCGAGETQFELDLLTDYYPSETSWEVKDSSGIVRASGSGYSTHSVLYTELACLQSWDYFTFTIFDSWGDGICCAYGNGAWTLKYDGIVFGSGGAFGETESVSFSLVTDSASLCEDDMSWRYNKKGCDWITGKPGHHCDFLGLDGRSAKEACPLSCSTCP